MKNLTLNEYQEKAGSTAIYPGKGTLVGLCYTVLGLNGEAGECGERVKKAMRDDGGELVEEKRQDLIKELGDLMWYTSQVATELGVTLEEVCNKNLVKLASRKERGVLGGSGSNR